jgi:hypothetical protein
MDMRQRIRSELHFNRSIMKNSPVIQLSFRQIISSSDAGEFENAIRRTSYNEFLLKSQVYNQENKYTRFTEMVVADGRANSLHYKSGFVIEPWILKFKYQIPHLKDHGGKSIPFINYRFELIESSLSDFEEHKVAIHYETNLYTWLATLGNAIVLSPENGKRDEEGFMSCFTVTVGRSLSIIKISGTEPSI